MKADEYVEIYIATEKIADVRVAVERVIHGLVGEIKELMEKRKVQSNSGALGVVKELNEKWIAIANRLKKRKGMAVLQEDGFKKILIKRVPGLAEYIH